MQFHLRRCTDRERKPERAGLTTPLMGWLELTDGASYLFGLDVLRCMEYHGTTKVRFLSFRCPKCLAERTRLTRTLRPCVNGTCFHPLCSQKCDQTLLLRGAVISGTATSNSRHCF
jgi:hypothetical protein